MAYTIRPATEADLPAILGIYEEARVFMRQKGNPTQWNGGYPSEALLRDDISKGHLYLCLEEERIAAVFCYFQGIDPTYIRIYEGQWLNDAPYGVIHRIAVNLHGKRIANRCYEWALTQCPELRIDTHRDNIPMQRSLEMFGFSRCGIIYLANGDQRIAFHKSLL